MKPDGRTAQRGAHPLPRWKPRLSVIMPTYAQAHFIIRALESLLAQSLRDWELLIIDDGSPDDTAARVNRTSRILASRIAGSTQTEAWGRH